METIFGEDSLAKAILENYFGWRQLSLTDAAEGRSVSPPISAVLGFMDEAAETILIIGFLWPLYGYFWTVETTIIPANFDFFVFAIQFFFYLKILNEHRQT